MSAAAILALLAALGAFLGHLFPVWLNFKGGKGVATYIGLLLALAWPAAIFFCVVWLAVAALTPLLIACGAHRQRGDAGLPLVYQRDLQEAQVLSAAFGAAVDHAPRQHRAADRGHRRQDRGFESPLGGSQRGHR